MPSRRPFFCTALGSLLLLLAGCQSYAPQPLDLPAHLAAVDARDLAAPEVVAYAHQLESRATTRLAATFDPADGLSIDEAQVVALFFNPHLRVARLKASVPRAAAAEAGRWEDPELAIDGERIVESVQHPWVLGGMLNLTLPLSGRLAKERDKAGAQATVEELRALAEEFTMVADLREQWLDWSAAQERAALARAYLADLDAIVKTADRLREAGELAPIDARLFRIERATRAAQAQSHDDDARARELKLKALLGLSPSAPIKLIPSLTSTGVPASVGMSQDHPTLRVARAEYDLAERALALEVQKQYPDLKLGGGFGTEDGENRVLFGAGVPLPIFNANRRAITEARAQRDAARASAQAEAERLRANRAEASLRLDAARARADYLARELAPLVDQQVADAKALGKLGDASTLILFEAMKSAHDAKLEIVEARLEAARAVTRLRYLTEESK